MQRKPFLLLILLMAFQLLPAQKLTILHTNDMHSRLLGFGPETDYTPFTLNDDQTIGGFSRIASILSEYRNKQPESLLILDAGDFLMGTIFHTAEAKTGFQLRLMKNMGYDLVSLGNHEFDFGPGELAKILTKSAEKPIPGMLLSNIRFDSASAVDDPVEELYRKGIMKSTTVLVRNGLRIGFFALMGKEADHVSPNAKPLKFTDQVQKATELAAMLREKEKVDLVICLSHCGLVFDPEKGWQGEDVELANQVPGIDVIISGHSHTSLSKPLFVNNIPIVQAGSEGRYVGKLEIEKTASGVKVIAGELIPVDDRIPGDPAIERQIRDQEELIGTDLFGPYHFSVSKPVIETSFGVLFNQQTNLATSTLGPLLADAIYYYAKKVDKNPTDVVMVNAGLVRDEILPGKSGKQLPADLFQILPLGMSDIDGTMGYSMCKAFVTGRELKNILEAMLIAKGQSSDYFPYWSGIRYKVNTLRMPLDRIYEIELGNDKDGYHKINPDKDPTKLYGLVTNSYVMKFLGVIKSSTKGLLSVVPKLADGKPVTDFSTTRIDRDQQTPGVQEAKEWAALITYLASLPDLNGNGIPDMPEKYRKVNDALQSGSSVNPAALFGATNGITVVPAVLIAAIVAGTLLLIF